MNDGLERRLAVLRAAYTSALGTRRAEIRSALQPGRADAEALQHARLLAHRMRGSAGSYGLPEVGAAAGRLEDAIAEYGRSAQNWPAVEAALEALEALEGT